MTQNQEATERETEIFNDIKNKNSNIATIIQAEENNKFNKN